VSCFTKYKPKDEKKIVETNYNPICLHFHIFKNAGTTIDWILQKNFKKHYFALDDTKKPSRILQWDYVIEFLKKQKSYPKAFSSHQIRFPLPQNSELEFLPIVFLRNPIDRAFSIYYFKKNQTDDSIGSTSARSMTLPDFIEWNLSKEKYLPMKNFQVFFLSRQDNSSEINLDDLVIAKNRLKDCKIIGVVERLDESLVVAEEGLRPYFEKIDLSYIKQNVSPERFGNFEERLEKGRSDIGNKLMEELIQKNKIDSLLHEFANEELDLRIKNINGFESKLDDFKNRCNNL